MSRFWSSLTHDLRPYVPGEQPRMVELVKLNTNENPLGPSPRALEAIRGEATDTLRLYPDPQATALRAALATYHQVRPEQVFVGNGSDEVLAHTFQALLKHDAPLLFPDITYSFYPVYRRGLRRLRRRERRIARSAPRQSADRPDPLQVAGPGWTESWLCHWPTTFDRGAGTGEGQLQLLPP